MRATGAGARRTTPSGMPRRSRLVLRKGLLALRITCTMNRLRSAKGAVRTRGIAAIGPGGFGFGRLRRSATLRESNEAKRLDYGAPRSAGSRRVRPGQARRRRPDRLRPEPETLRGQGTALGYRAESLGGRGPLG